MSVDFDAIADRCYDRGRQDAIEAAAQIAEERAIKLRAKAKAQSMPSRQSYFAQAIEARVIADLIRALT